MAEETPACELEGRELEVAVEREVFGNRVERTEDGNDWICPELEVAQVTFDGDGNRTAERVPPTVPPYTADIAAAWEVVEAMLGWASEDRSEPGLAVKVLQYCDPQCRDAPWQAVFYSLDTDDRGWPHEGFAAEADTAPLTICRAALAAVRGSR